MQNNRFVISVSTIFFKTSLNSLKFLDSQKLSKTHEKDMLSFLSSKSVIYSIYFYFRL